MAIKRLILEYTQMFTYEILNYAPADALCYSSKGPNDFKI